MSVSGKSEAELVEELSRVFEQHHRLFTSVAAQNLVPRIKREAEDVVQEAFLAAFEQIGNFRGESNLKTWVSIMVLRTAWRRNKHHEPTLGNYLEVEKTPGMEVPSFEQQIEDRDMLEKLIPHLTPAQREFIGAWMTGEFKGKMDEHKNRNLLSRSKTRMKEAARERGVLENAA